MTNTAPAAQANEPANPPVAKIRVGLITASIWGRETEKGRFYATSFERRYKTQQGQWQTSHSYDPGDLLELAKAADLAHTKILELRATDTGTED
jgi:hypothetical protein